MFSSTTLLNFEQFQNLVEHLAVLPVTHTHYSIPGVFFKVLNSGLLDSSGVYANTDKISVGPCVLMSQHLI
jgi:hypothetical protein